MNTFSTRDPTPGVEHQHIIPLLAAARRTLARALRKEFATAQAYKRQQIKANALQGYCGWAQSFLAYAAKDAGLKASAFAIQSLPTARFGHVALTIATPDGKVWLLDPTFNQFCRETNNNQPPAFLGTQPHGRMMAHRLTKKGYCEITPELAALYLAAFCGGKSPFDSDQAAFDFMASPPHSRYNFWYPKSAFAQLGCI